MLLDQGKGSEFHARRNPGTSHAFGWCWVETLMAIGFWHLLMMPVLAYTVLSQLRATLPSYLGALKFQQLWRLWLEFQGDKVLKYPLLAPFKWLTLFSSGRVLLRCQDVKGYADDLFSYSSHGLGINSLGVGFDYPISKPWLLAVPNLDCFAGTHAQLAAWELLNTGWTLHFVNLSTSWVDMWAWDTAVTIWETSFRKG